MTYPTVHKILPINWSSMFLFYADNSTSTRSSWSKSPIKSENSSNSTGKAKPKSTIIPSEEEGRKMPCFKSKSPPETSSACPGTWKKTSNYPQSTKPTLSVLTWRNNGNLRFKYWMQEK